jgi:mandelamide amidase
MTSKDEMPSFTVTEAIAALNSKRMTSYEYVEVLLERIAAFNEPLNAVLHVNNPGALEEAKRMDKLRSEGKLLGSLHGIPMLIKDNINVAGIPTTGATPGLRGNIPSKSAPVAKALQDAGVIVLGKTNLSELACSYSTCNTSFAGICHNPYKLDHITGGSSGGSGASVAARFAPAALLTDTFGSTRCPSLCNGIYGFRPTHGRYSTEGVIPLVSMFDTVGPGARSIADLQLLDTVMSGGDDTQVRVEAKGLRVGISRKFFYEGLTPDVEKAFADSLAKLEAAGVVLVNEDIPTDVSGNFQDMLVLCTENFVHDLDEYLKAEIADPHNPFKEKWGGKDLINQVSNPVSKGIMEQVSNPAPAETLAALKQKRRDQRKCITEHFTNFRIDCVFYPGCASTALPISAGDMAGIAAFNGRYNVAPFNTLPACAIPVGLSSEGLPIGAEVLGAPSSDRRTLEIAKVLEGVIGHIAPPVLK